MPTKFATHQLKVTKTDPDTGLVVETETTKVMPIKLASDDEFYMVYIKFTAAYYDLKYADDIKILAKMCEWAEFEKGNVYMTSKRRKELRDLFNMHNSNISTSIKRLKEKNLISGADGDFLINPTVFWKGSKKTRLEMIQKGEVQMVFNFKLEDKSASAQKGIEPNTEY